MPFYAFTLPDTAGNATATYNYVSLFNPAGSTKVALVYELTYANYAIKATSAISSKQVSRISAASAGTLQSAAAIGKLDTTYPDPQCEVRTVNPTVTAAAVMLSLPPAGFQASARYEWSADQKIQQILLYPGQGLSLRQTVAADTSENISFTLRWEEH